MEVAEQADTGRGDSGSTTTGEGRPELGAETRKLGLRKIEGAAGAYGGDGEAGGGGGGEALVTEGPLGGRAWMRSVNRESRSNTSKFSKIREIRAT